ncbi:MAG: hypothetical protein KJO38_08815, partial [Gammaproteobacteria bacterium]|nr:hypothetical protein [Gammaproteobacteria bacterium]
MRLFTAKFWSSLLLLIWSGTIAAGTSPPGLPYTETFANRAQVADVLNVRVGSATDLNVLLVDDDDDDPDMQLFWTRALEKLGSGFSLFVTGGSDVAPDAATLADFDVVIWFNGDAFGAGGAGPDATGEAALATWLDGGQGRCLIMNSQDYHFDRGLTPFMQTYLGVASVDDDVGVFRVTGSGPFSVLGPATLSNAGPAAGLPANYTDGINPDGTATT